MKTEKTKAQEALDKLAAFAYDGCHTENAMDGIAAVVKTIRKALQQNEKLVSIISQAAICLLQPNNGISDTIWMKNGNITLYEHLVSALDVDLTGDIDGDIKALAEYEKGEK